MNATRSQLITQFNRAKKLGWIPFFIEAAQITKGYFDTADLMGIGSRETNLDPKWLTKAGDRGNGFGLMQADKRSFPDWIKTGQWKDARQGILKGAEVLMMKWRDVQSGIGVKRGVTSSKTGKTSYYFGKDVQGAEAQKVTIASYNAGRWAHYAASKDQDPDAYTTGRDYSRDVLERAQVFRELLAKDSTAATEPPTSELPGNSASSNSPTAPANETPPSIKTEESTQTIAKEGDATVIQEQKTVAEQPKGDAPDVPPTKVSKNGPLANWLFGSGALTTFGTAIWGFVSGHLDAVAIGIICLTLLIIVIIFRGAITDALRMHTAADVDKKNVS